MPSDRDVQEVLLCIHAVRRMPYVARSRQLSTEQDFITRPYHQNVKAIESTTDLFLVYN